MKNTWFSPERPTDSGGTVYVKPERTHKVRVIYVPIPMWECSGCPRKWLASALTAAEIEQLECRP